MLNYDLARKRRKWLEISQQAIALEIGVDPSAVARWETGKQTPSLEQLVAWAKQLRLRPVDIAPVLLEGPERNSEAEAQAKPEPVGERSA
jgi:transcriptional regulator with XRE-family HTH domain